MKLSRGDVSTPAESERNFFAGGGVVGECEEEERAGVDDGAFTSAGEAPTPGMHAAFQALLWFLFLPFPLPFPLGWLQSFRR